MSAEAMPEIEGGGEAQASAADGSRLLTAGELSERWQVSERQVYRLTREGKLPTVEIGRYYRYRLAAIEAWECDGGAGSE